MNVTPPILNVTEDSCVPMLPLKDLKNLTYECEAVNATVLWQLGRYQLVDRDEFQTDGVLTLANMGTASLTIYPAGVMFLFGQLQQDVMEVTCLAVVDDVNVEPSPSVESLRDWGGQGRVVSRELAIFFLRTQENNGWFTRLGRVSGRQNIAVI